MFLPGLRSASAVALFASILQAQQPMTIEQVIELNQQPSQSPGNSVARLLLSGQCESSNSEESGPFEIRISSPGVALNLNRGDLMTAFDGNEIWRMARGQEAIALPGGPVVDAVAIFDPARRRRWKELYPKIAIAKQDGAGDGKVYVLETNPGAPGSTRFFVDTRSGDLLRAELAAGVTFELSDFRSAGIWKIPFRIAQRTARGDVYTFVVTHAESGVIVDDALFRMPRTDPK